MDRSEDNLEKYIRENRKRLDKYSPHNSVRSSIFSSSTGGRRLIVASSLLRAASAALIACIAIFLAYYTGARHSSSLSARMNPELRETEQYYEVLMNSVFSRVNLIFAEYPGLENEVRADIDELEEIGRELREDLSDNISNKEVVEALIRNYRLRIRLLEDLVENLPGYVEKQYANPLKNEI
jgi:hypothetical protein